MIDGMIVREMVRRCSFNIDRVLAVLNALECRDPWEHSGAKEERAIVNKLWKHYMESGFLSARILDHLSHRSIDLVDKDVIQDLIDSLPEKPFEVLTVHDAFRCLPNYGNDLRKQYTLLLSDIARSDLLSFLMSQLAGEDVPVTKLDPDMWGDVLETEYALS